MLLLGLSISSLGKPFPIDNALAEATIGDARSHRLARRSVWTAPGLHPALRTPRVVGSGRSARGIRSWPHRWPHVLMSATRTSGPGDGAATRPPSRCGSLLSVHRPLP